MPFSFHFIKHKGFLRVLEYKSLSCYPFTCALSTGAAILTVASCKRQTSPAGHMQQHMPLGACSPNHLKVGHPNACQRPILPSHAFACAQPAFLVEGHHKGRGGTQGDRVAGGLPTTDSSKATSHLPVLPSCTREQKPLALMGGEAARKEVGRGHQPNRPPHSWAASNGSLTLGSSQPLSAAPTSIGKPSWCMDWPSHLTWGRLLQGPPPCLSTSFLAHTSPGAAGPMPGPQPSKLPMHRTHPQAPQQKPSTTQATGKGAGGRGGEDAGSTAGAQCDSLEGMLDHLGCAESAIRMDESVGRP